MSERNKVVADEVLNKEFLSQFKTESDVSKFLKQLHAQVLEKMLEAEMDVHLGYEKNSVSGNNSGNSRNGKYPKKFKPSTAKLLLMSLVTVTASLNLLSCLNMKAVVYPLKNLSFPSTPKV